MKRNKQKFSFPIQENFNTGSRKYVASRNETIHQVVYNIETCRGAWSFKRRRL